MSKVRIYNKTLCPKLWDNMVLNPHVRINLLQIAKDFYEKLDYKAPIKDILLMGSSANYNWTPTSDLDVHILIDFKQLQMPDDSIPSAVRTVSSQWNSEHNIIIKDHKVEINIQDIADEKLHVTGIYSILKNCWIRVPHIQNLKIDKDAIVNKYTQLKDYIEKSIRTNEKGYMKSVKEYIDSYRQYGLDSKGELSTENLVFKLLRSKGFLKKLKDSITLIYDKEMSLKEQFYNSFNNMSSDGYDCVDIFKNPSSQEIKECESRNYIGAILLDKDIYIWNRDKAYHRNIMEKLGNNKKSLPILIWMNPRGYQIMITDSSRDTQWFHNKNALSYIKSHPFFKLHKILSVVYYDEDVVGKWENLKNVDEVTQKDLKARHPQPPVYVSFGKIPFKKLTLDNLKALKDKSIRSYNYYAKRKNRQELSQEELDDLRNELIFLNKINVEIKNRIKNINKPVAIKNTNLPFQEGYGAGNPEDDSKIPSGKRWTVKFDSDSSILTEGFEQLYIGYIYKDNFKIIAKPANLLKVKDHGGLPKIPNDWSEVYAWRYRKDLKTLYWWINIPDQKYVDEVEHWIRINTKEFYVIKNVRIGSGEDAMDLSHGSDFKEGFDPTSAGPNPQATEGQPPDINYYDDQNSKMSKMEESNINYKIFLKELLIESPKMDTLKANKKPLSDDERKVILSNKAVWHSPDGKETCGIWKSIIKGKTWYVCNTHRAYQCKPTLKGAIKAFEFIKTTS